MIRMIASIIRENRVALLCMIPKLAIAKTRAFSLIPIPPIVMGMLETRETKGIININT